MNKSFLLFITASLLVCSSSNAGIFDKKTPKIAIANPVTQQASTTKKRVLVVPAQYKDTKVIVVGSEEYNELLSNKKIGSTKKGLCKSRKGKEGSRRRVNKPSKDERQNDKRS